MATTPTSIINRLMGLETFTDPLLFAVPPLVSSGGGLVTVAAATTTLTLTPAAHAGRIILVQSTGGLAVTPPAATGTGYTYTFMVITTVSGGSFTVDAKAGNASDVFQGPAQMVLSGGTTFLGFPTAANSNLLTLNGTTTGGVAGSTVTMTDVATNKWQVLVESLYTSTGATPFSNH